jgi:hypothetical protein
MRQSANFRLDNTVITTITVLAKDLHLSKTAIIEKAVTQFAALHVNKRSELLQFAGALPPDEADNMLVAIQTGKTSKEFALDL